MVRMVRMVRSLADRTFQPRRRPRVLRGRRVLRRAGELRGVAGLLRQGAARSAGPVRVRRGELQRRVLLRAGPGRVEAPWAENKGYEYQ